jgi:Mg2+ and Co2+ transporter CorA
MVEFIKKEADEKAKEIELKVSRDKRSEENLLMLIGGRQMRSMRLRRLTLSVRRLLQSTNSTRRSTNKHRWRNKSQSLALPTRRV